MALGCPKGAKGKPELHVSIGRAGFSAQPVLTRNENQSKLSGCLIILRPLGVPKGSQRSANDPGARPQNRCRGLLVEDSFRGLMVAVLVEKSWRTRILDLYPSISQSNQSNQSVNQSIIQSINESVSQTISQSINRSTNQSINRSSHETINQ